MCECMIIKKFVTFKKMRFDSPNIKLIRSLDFYHDLNRTVTSIAP